MNSGRSSTKWINAIVFCLVAGIGPWAVLARAVQESEPIRIAEPRADSVVVGHQAVVVVLSQGVARSLVRLDCFVDGRLVGSRDKPPFSFDLDFGPTPDEHEIEVVAAYDRDKSVSAKLTTRPLKVDYDASVREVLIPVAVTDQSGHFRPGMKREDFKAFDGEVPIGIKDVWEIGLPLHVALLLDASSSMYERIHAARRALDTLISDLHREDRVSLSSFLATPQMLLSADGSRSDVLRLSHEMRVSHLGFTGIFDSAYGVLEKEFSKEDAARANVLVVVTDGLDTVSHRRPADVAAYAKVHGVPLLVVAVRSPDDETESELPAEERLAHRRLAEWASAARGQAFFTSSGRDLDNELRTAVKDLRARYMVSLEPAGEAEDVKDLRLHPVAMDVEIWFPSQLLSSAPAPLN